MTRKRAAVKDKSRKPTRFATTEFDREMVIDSFSASPDARTAKWTRAVAKRGRS